MRLDVIGIVSSVATGGFVFTAAAEPFRSCPQRPIAIGRLKFDHNLINTAFYTATLA